jgi:UDP:flavonoid glycosyltransferase YjiC (YdhE family)
MKIGIQTWGSEGDVRPFLALAAGLAGEGHRVTVAATTSPLDAYSRIASTHGFAFDIVGDESAATLSKDDLLSVCFDVPNPLRQAELLSRHAFDPFEPEMVQAAVQLCRDNDLVVGHFFLYPLRLAAAATGVPWASVCFAHNCMPSRSIPPPGLPRLGSWLNPVGWRLVRKLVSRIFLPRVNRLAHTMGFPPFKDVMTEVWASELLTLMAVSPSLCPRPPDWPPGHRVCGFLTPPDEGPGEPLSADLWNFLADGPPPVYFTFGSMMPDDPVRATVTLDLWREAAALAGCRAILQSAASVNPPFRSHRETFVLSRAPHRKVFTRCAAVVHHGGAGTVQTTLLSGCPSVVVAHLADQFFWGAELQRNGVASKPLVRKNLTPAKLAPAIRQVLDQPTMKARAEELKLKMQEEDGVGAAVKWIEEAHRSWSAPIAGEP